MSQQKSATIKLKYPVQLPDRTLREVTMRRPTVRDIVENPVRNAADMDGELELMCRLCGLTPDDVMDMDAADYDVLREQYVFFRSGAGTGGSDAPGIAALPSGGVLAGDGAVHDTAGD